MTPIDVNGPTSSPSSNRPDKALQEQWLKEDRYWKWGIFYYNPEDTRILPPKRNPAYGWTVNFAQRKSIWLFIAMVGLPVLAVFLLLLLSRA